MGSERTTLRSLVRKWRDKLDAENGGLSGLEGAIVDELEALADSGFFIARMVRPGEVPESDTGYWLCIHPPREHDRGPGYAVRLGRYVAKAAEHVTVAIPLSDLEPEEDGGRG